MIPSQGPASIALPPTAALGLASGPALTDGQEPELEAPQIGNPGSRG